MSETKKKLLEIYFQITKPENNFSALATSSTCSETTFYFYRRTDEIS